MQRWNNSGLTDGQKTICNYFDNQLIVLVIFQVVLLNMNLFQVNECENLLYL